MILPGPVTNAVENDIFDTILSLTTYQHLQGFQGFDEL